MTKLEWCRKHAPESLKDMSDEELLEMMESSYKRFCNTEVREDAPTFESVEYNPINTDMDYMVLELVREFGDKLAFKGGYMLTKLIPDTARQTADIDFSIQSSELYQALIHSMERLGKRFVSEGKVSTYRVKADISKTKSGGMDMYDSSGSKVLGIDVGWHDITFGTTTTSIDVCTLRAFEVERMLADKITAILSAKRFRRPKDLYDLYCITNCLDFDAEVVNKYILLRTNGVGAEWDNFPFDEDTVIKYSETYNNLVIRSIRKDVELERPAFKDVFARFNVICRRLLNVDGLNKWDSRRECFVRK